MQRNNSPNRLLKIVKTIVLDIAGVLLIITAALFGWLPGVAGIPLFLAGLGLLAINHAWARRLLEHVKRHGVRLFNAFFKDHPFLVLLYDVAAVLSLIGAGMLVGFYTNNLARGFAGVLAFVGMGLLLGNRHRIERINAFVKKVTRRNKA